MTSRMVVGITAALCTSLLTACGSITRDPLESPPRADVPATPVQPPFALPTDGLQPWERPDERGFAEPKGSSAITADSEFVPGVERFSEGGNVAELGEAFSIGSAAQGTGCAIYRIPLGGEQPGAVSVDANLHGVSEYWVAVSDYASMRWSWRGPFSETQITLDLPAGSYLSPLGKLFICVLTFDGNSLDLVAVGAALHDETDTIAPPAPGTPQLTPGNRI